MLWDQLLCVCVLGQQGLFWKGGVYTALWNLRKPRCTKRVTCVSGRPWILKRTEVSGELSSWYRGSPSHSRVEEEGEIWWCLCWGGMGLHWMPGESLQEVSVCVYVCVSIICSRSFKNQNTLILNPMKCLTSTLVLVYPTNLNLKQT